MSYDEVINPGELATGDSSLRGRLAERRTKLREQRYIELDVPGYEGLLRARYIPLDYRVLRAIGKRSEKLNDAVEQEITVASDTLAAACITLLDISGPEPRDLQLRWSTRLATELFGIDENEIGATVRDAMIAIFPDINHIVLHFAEYSAKATDVSDEISREMEGESVATLAVA